MSVSAGWSRLFIFCCWAVLALGLQAAEITVVGYNVYNYLPMKRSVDGKYGYAPKPESEIAPLIEVIAGLKPDILGVSEMGGKEQLADFQSRLAKAGVDLPHTEWVQGVDKERHVVLLSRFPITERNSVSEVPIAINGQAEGMQRGILDVTVEVTPQFPLRLMGAHFKSRRIVPEFDEAALRTLESLELRKHIEMVLAAKPDTKLLIYGDFNDTKNEEPIRNLLSRKNGPSSLKMIDFSDEFGEKWTHYWKTADEYGRIDYMFVSKALAPHILAEKSFIPRIPNLLEASDHRPLVLKIQIPD